MIAWLFNHSCLNDCLLGSALGIFTIKTSFESVSE